MSISAADILLREREKLIIVRDAAIARFNAEIQELETSIERLSGKRVWEMAGTTIYDDEHPDYIKSSSVED
jgi:hypothetical protein